MFHIFIKSIYNELFMIYKNFFKGEEKNLLRVVDSIFASGYLTAGGQGIKDTIQAIEDAGFTYEIESA